MAHRGSRAIAILFLDHGTRRGSGIIVTPRPHFTPGKDSVPIVQEAGWAPGPVWTGAENLAPNGIRSPDRPARRQSLNRLRYPAHQDIPNQVVMSPGKSVFVSHYTMFSTKAMRSFETSANTYLSKRRSITKGSDLQQNCPQNLDLTNIICSK